MIGHRHRAELAELDAWTRNCEKGLERQLKCNESNVGG